MPKYLTTVDRWISHECRTAKAGETFETTFPKVKVDGKLVDMKLSDTLKLVEDAQAPTTGKKGKGSDDLV